MTERTTRAELVTLIERYRRVGVEKLLALHGVRSAQ